MKKTKHIKIEELTAVERFDCKGCYMWICPKCGGMQADYSNQAIPHPIDYCADCETVVRVGGEK